MYRGWLFGILGLVLAALPLAVSGCEEKRVTVQQTEQRHESEPQMVSPGEEVVVPD